MADEALQSHPESKDQWSESNARCASVKRLLSLRGEGKDFPRTGFLLDISDVRVRRLDLVVNGSFSCE